VLFFPISYIFGDILTRCTGTAGSRVVWPVLGPCICLHHGGGGGAFAGVEKLARQPGGDRTVFGNTLVSYWRPSPLLCGTFVNSYVLAKMKIRTQAAGCGRASSARRCARLVDSMIFYFVAFYGRMPGLICGHYVYSICAEKRMGNHRDPLTYA